MGGEQAYSAVGKLEEAAKDLKQVYILLKQINVDLAASSHSVSPL